MVIKLKLLILSDIHGDHETLYKVIKKEDFDKLIVLGDLFNYGEKVNDKIINLLQKNKNKLILIKGNCDNYIEYEKLGLFAHDIFTYSSNNHMVTFTHGNRYSKGFLPEYHGDIFISGHTHIPVLTKERGVIYVNPGSIGRPRGGSTKSYLIFENNKIIIKDINNKVQKEMII